MISLLPKRFIFFCQSKSPQNSFAAFGRSERSLRINLLNSPLGFSTLGNQLFPEFLPSGTPHFVYSISPLVLSSFWDKMLLLETSLSVIFFFFFLEFQRKAGKGLTLKPPTYQGAQRELSAGGISFSHRP